MQRFCTFLFFALFAGCSQAWTPPNNPDPQAILKEAEADARAGRYSDALAKQVWFFQDALKYDSSEYGVRLSFALSDWADLAKVYPPALEKLKESRDKAEENVRSGKAVRDNFSDFGAINKELKEDSKTSDLFIWVDSNKPDSAKDVIDLAEPALIKSKQYSLINKYIKDPFAIYDNEVRMYDQNMQIAKDPQFGKRVSDFADDEFKNKTATLIAILVVNNRQGEAKAIASDITKLGLPQDKDQIQKALNGEVPPPWP